MRDILFKAKRLYNGEWVQGSLVFTPDADKEFRTIIIPCYDNGEYTEGDNDECLGFETWYKVYENTICQYTGLTDKNGNKKWRGDIFECSNGDYLERYYIEWDEASLQWEAVCIADSDGNLPLCEFSADEIDVIGNIFDNPELLEREG